jgi:hypothetical protein
MGLYKKSGVVSKLKAMTLALLRDGFSVLLALIEAGLD